MDKCCWDCCKFILFIINFAALLAVGAVLGGAIYVLIQSKEILGFDIDTDLSNLNHENPTAIYFSFLLIIIVIFSFLVIFTFLGCCGAACQNQCMLGSFIIILSIFLGATVAGIGYVFLHFHDEVEMARNELDKTIPYYNPEEEISLVKNFWDFVQPNLKCCGPTGWQDWSAAKKMKNDQKVPKSCCFDVSSSSSQAESWGTGCEYSPTGDKIYLEGCMDKVKLPFRITFWAIPSLMAFVLVSALIVCSRHSKASGETRRNRNSHQQSGGDYTEGTGYMYRASATPDYPTAPPYNPDFPPHQNPYADHLHYPTGVIPPHSEQRQPLIQPPAYHDVVQGR